MSRFNGVKKWHLPVLLFGFGTAFAQEPDTDVLDKTIDPGRLLHCHSPVRRAPTGGIATVGARLTGECMAARKRGLFRPCKHNLDLNKHAFTAERCYLMLR